MREPKSVHKTSVQIQDRNGHRKGRLELTSGNLTYFRKNAHDPAVTVTLQQLAELLEASAIADRTDAPVHIPTPRGQRDIVITNDSEEDPVSVSFRALPGMGYADGVRFYLWPPKSMWTVQVSVHGALRIVQAYAEELLAPTNISRGEFAQFRLPKERLRGLLLAIAGRLARG